MTSSETTAAQVHHFSTGNLRVRLETLPWAGSFGAALVVGCGSRDDLPGLEGTAHMAEHLNVLGGPAPGPPTLPVLAVTEIDRTVYRTTGDPLDGLAAIRHLVDLTNGHRTRTTPRVFEGERHAVLLETRRMDHRPVQRLGPLIAAAAADEPGLDAIARTTTRSVSRITQADVHALVHGHYPRSPSQLFVAGPPALHAVVEELLASHRGTAPVAEAHPVAAPRPVPDDAPVLTGLNDLTAVTLLRPRAPGTALDALVHPYGPILTPGGAARPRPLGRTTIAGRGRQVDIVLWDTRAEDVTAALERSLPAVAADWHALTRETVTRLETAAAQAERRDRAATPAARVRAAADRHTFAHRSATTARLALWRITRGVPHLLAEHLLAGNPLSPAPA
ncbi:hypothetical protein ACIA8O_21740 [Kitasatospora sp. NPDC051853]|uniref:hypothetical protein n=1 Tax=Kitasatospora sp. NPDC051853 TaxID=3364058 RepID=UPI0037ABAD22